MKILPINCRAVKVTTWFSKAMKKSEATFTADSPQVIF